MNSIKVQNLEITKYLVKNGADLHCRWNGPIRFAKDPELIQYLNDNGIFHRKNGYEEYDDYQYSDGFNSDQSDNMYFSEEYYV